MIASVVWLHKHTHDISRLGGKDKARAALAKAPSALPG